MSVSARSANRRTAIAALIVGAFAACISSPPPALHAQTPPAAPPCPSTSILLTAKPIYGVGVTTIKHACPAFLTALSVWYASHPDATVAQAVAAITGVPLAPPPPVVVQPPVVTPPPVIPSGSGLLYLDDFSKYTSTADFIANFWAGTKAWPVVPGVSRVWRANPSQPGITYDVAEKALRYDWPARDSTASCFLEQTIALMPGLYPPPTGMKDLWVRFQSKESPNFETGKFGCARAYKFFLIQFESGSKQGRVGVYLGPASNTAPGPTRLVMDMVGRLPGDTARGPDGFPLPGGVPSWGGSYHEWILGLEGIGTASTRFSVYLDKQLIRTMSAPFLTGQVLGAAWAVTFEMGANINSGPDHVQSRWWRFLEVGTAKPAGLP